MSKQDKSKHTPGPWKVIKEFGEFEIQNNLNTGIAYVMTKRKEDAQLIAAAPDLLAAAISWAYQYLGGTY